MSERICDLTAIDAETLDTEFREEIVRCRDCEYARHYHPLDWRTGKPHETVEEWYCEWHSSPEGASEIEPDGFCAWGERRSDG